MPLSVAAFVVAGAVTAARSIRLAALGDDLADHTGWGEALFGAVFFVCSGDARSDETSDERT